MAGRRPEPGRGDPLGALYRSYIDKAKFWEGYKTPKGMCMGAYYRNKARNIAD
jgi:hypothetical protein